MDLHEPLVVAPAPLLAELGHALVDLAHERFVPGLAFEPWIHGFRV
jgi:hypothetical protein